MDRIRKLWQGEQAYEPIEDSSENASESDPMVGKRPTLSYVEYSIFVLLGVSMLWAWNMFLAAAPYFQYRFRSSEWISENFQAAEISVSTVTNLIVMLILTRLQKRASYPKRIISSLIINMFVFALLALSTSVFDKVSAEGYFGFLMVMILSTSLATGLCQNGIFAYVSGFGQPVYTSGIMTGQGIAGVLPCVAQIIFVLGIRGDDPRSGTNSEVLQSSGVFTARSKAALAYFLTALVVALSTLVAFLYLLARKRNTSRLNTNAIRDSSEHEEDSKAVPLMVLFKKLRWLACAIFTVFVVTMFFPVFTQKIVSVRPVEDQTPLLQPASFVPLAFLLWNIGDLVGRMSSAIPAFSLVFRPRLVFFLALSRVVFIGMYHLCNIRGLGAVVQSDAFYLIVVQLLFGLSNGYLGSICMIGASEWVDPEERQAAGSFMGLCLVAGLSVGSLLSFLAAG